MSFHYSENLFPLAKMKDFIKKRFHQMEKLLSRVSEKWRKKGFYQSEHPSCRLSFRENKLFLWKLFIPNSNNGFYQQQYSSDQKNIFSITQKIRLRQVNEGQKNRFPQQEYGLSLKTDFPTNKKHVSTSRNEGLAKKYDPVDGKNTFTDNS